MFLHQWAAKWGVSPQALHELQVELGEAHPDSEDLGRSERAIENDVVLKAAKQGWPLWRNNVGAYETETGRWMRFGLANTSEKENKIFKSSDRIGCRPILITQQMVGSTIGQFTALEIKKSDWAWTGTVREVAQGAFIRRVLALGGYARFINNPEQLP